MEKIEEIERVAKKSRDDFEHEMRVQGEERANYLRRMARKGKSPYMVDKETSFDIPCFTASGRTEPLGRTFSGMIDFVEGRLRFDCAEELPFYLDVNLGRVPLFKDFYDRSVRLEDTKLFKALQKSREIIEVEDSEVEADLDLDADVYQDTDPVTK